MLWDVTGETESKGLDEVEVLDTACRTGGPVAVVTVEGDLLK